MTSRAVSVRDAGLALLTLLATALALAACGASTSSSHSRAAQQPPGSGSSSANTTSTAVSSNAAKGASQPAPPPKPAPPPYPQLLSTALGAGPTSFVPVVLWQGHRAAWVSRTSAGVALMRFDQRYLELHLHSGTSDAGTLGWRFGPSISGLELKRLAAAFNGGFRLSTGAGGFASYGRVAVPVSNGLGSIVTYSNGYTDVGTWSGEVPARGKRVVSVRQNLAPLIDHGTPAPNAGCDSCWGATLHGVSDPARSALGVTRNGTLVWAAGEHLAVSTLVSALLNAHVVRAVELDINPEWVAGYLYGHRGGKGRSRPCQWCPVSRASRGSSWPRGAATSSRLSADEAVRGVEG
jgi:hypothetical protein